MKQVTEFAIDLSADVNDSRLAALTRDLRNDLIRSTELIEVENSVPTEGGTRGDALTLGHLILTFMTSGVATALVNCITAYIKREPSLTASLKRPDGSAIQLSIHNIDDPAILASVSHLLEQK